MLSDQSKTQKTIEKIVSFAKQHGLGIDMNIEGLANFSQEECYKHAKFLSDLGVALKKEGITYRVVTVAEDGNLFHGKWRNALLRDCVCDYVVVMQYDPLQGGVLRQCLRRQGARSSHDFLMPAETTGTCKQ